MIQTTLWIVATACSLLALQSSQQHVDPWPAEPQSPIFRTDPYEYRLGLAVDIGATSEVILEPRVLVSTGGDFVVDILTASNWTLANTDKINSSLRINGIPVASKPSLKGKPGDEMYSCTLPIPSGNINALSFRIEWPVISFNSKVDEAQAALKTWPQEWPENTQAYLRPSRFIQSGDNRYVEFVQRTTQGKLRKVPPYYAAKDLVRAAIKEHRNVDPSFVFSENSGSVRGFDVRAIRDLYRRPQFQASQSPSATDLVCDCIAVLRTAGIPARPVIGIQSGNMVQIAPQIAPRRIRFVVWGEFYLPDAGWVPFDPNLMRGTSMSHLPVQKKWDFFGTIAHLNRRAGIAYDFAPFGQGSILGFPGGWALRLSGEAFGPFEFVDVTSPLLNASGPIQP